MAGAGAARWPPCAALPGKRSGACRGDGYRPRLPGNLAEDSLRDRAAMERFRVLAPRHFGSWAFALVRIPASDLRQKIALLQQGMVTDDTWYNHFFRDDELVVVFRDAVFIVTTDPAAWAPACRARARWRYPSAATGLSSGDARRRGSILPRPVTRGQAQRWHRRAKSLPPGTPLLGAGSRRPPEPPHGMSSAAFPGLSGTVDLSAAPTSLASALAPHPGACDPRRPRAGRGRGTGPLAGWAFGLPCPAHTSARRSGPAPGQPSAARTASSRDMPPSSVWYTKRAKCAV